jgi:hypothetical protein
MLLIAFCLKLFASTTLARAVGIGMAMLEATAEHTAMLWFICH